MVTDLARGLRDRFPLGAAGGRKGLEQGWLVAGGRNVGLGAVGNGLGPGRDLGQQHGGRVVVMVRIVVGGGGWKT